MGSGVPSLCQCLIHHADSVSNLDTVFEMLRGCILSRDAKAVQGLTEDITGEIAQTLFTAGARALVVNDQCKAQEKEIKELKQVLAQREDDLKVAWETCNLYLADFQKCDKERVLAEGRATKAKEDATILRVTRAREVEFARNKGYDEGWDVTGVEYKKQVREIEAKLYRDRFLDGLRLGIEALLRKLDLPEDSELRALPEAPPPPEELVVPEEEDEQVPNPEVEALHEDQTDPNAPAPTDA